MDIGMKQNVYFVASRLLKRDTELEPKCSWSQGGDLVRPRISKGDSSRKHGETWGSGRDGDVCSETNNKEMPDRARDPSPGATML